MSDIDTFNKFMVGAVGDKVAIMNPPRTPISKDEALVLAAWIVTLASDFDRTRFDAALKAVQADD